MVLGARGPRAGRPSLDLVPVRLSLPRPWLLRIGKGNVQRFVREAVAAKLEE